MGERERGCGWRKIGGLYLVGRGQAVPCAALPYPIDNCPCCRAGLKFSRGFAWIARTFFRIDPGPRSACSANGRCVFTGNHERVGLMWVGEKYYTPTAFTIEAQFQGVSKRIAQLPRGLVIGETWILLAHKKAICTVAPGAAGALFPSTAPNWRPGVFYAFRPERIELIVTQEQLDAANEKQHEKWEHAGISPVVVPDELKHRAREKEEAA